MALDDPERTAPRRAEHGATAPDGRGAQRSPWGHILTLSWSHLLNDGASNYLPGVLPAILVSLGDPTTMAGGLMAVLIAGQAFQPVAGWIADRLGGKSMTAAGLLLTSLGGGLLGLAHSTWLVIVLLAIIGVGGALFHPQALATVRDAIRGRHGLVTSVFLVGGEIGRGLWPTVASFIVANFGLDGLWVIALPGLVTIPVIYRVVPSLPAKPRSAARIDWRAHLRPLGLLVGYRSTQSLATYAVATFIPIIWHARGGSLVSGASIITTMITVGIIGNLVGGHLADRIGRRPLLVIASVGIAVLIVPMAYLTGPLLWVCAGLLGISLFLSGSPTILIGQDIFPENRSMGSGLALGFVNGIGAFLVFIVGLWVTGDGVAPIFVAVAVLSVAAIPLALALPASLMERSDGELR